MAEERKANVIVILADDLGWSDTTLYGNTKFYKTPNLDRLAKRGMTFTRAYSASPLCSPTRSALLTGMSPARTGITIPNGHVPQVVLEASVPAFAAPNEKAISPNPPTRLKSEYRTLAEELRDAGYATGHFGKWHLGTPPFSPLEQGFEVDVPKHPGPGPAGSFVAPWRFAHIKESKPGEHIEDRMAQEAVAWIEKNQDRPFYLNYWMFSVHAPFDAKKDLIEKYREQIDVGDSQRSPTYAAMIESMDDAVGTLLDTLDRLGIADNTIIVFTADNGGNMYNEIDGTTPTHNRPLRGGKATLFEGGTRVPCVIVWPGVVSPASRSDVPVQSEDYFPTILAGLGIQPTTNQPCDGVSIIPALKGEEMIERSLFQFFPHSPRVPEWLPPSISVHHGDWKLIRVFHGGENGEHRHLLFNLRDDLGETSNQALAHPSIVKELSEEIDAFLIKTKAVVPTPNPRFDPEKYDPSLEGVPQAKPKAKQVANENTPESAKRDESDPALQGWKARNCNASVTDGAVTIVPTNDNSFLGFAAGKHNGASRVRFRIKASSARSHVDWLPGGVTSEAKSVPFAITGNDWEEIDVPLPAEGPLGIVRIYLPKEAGKVQIDWIEIISAQPEKKTQTGF